MNVVRYAAIAATLLVMIGGFATLMAASGATTASPCVCSGCPGGCCECTLCDDCRCCEPGVDCCPACDCSDGCHAGGSCCANHQLGADDSRKAR